MHGPYRLMMLIFAATVALTQGPSDRTRKPEARQPEAEVAIGCGKTLPWDCTAIVSSYHRLQEDINRFKNDYIGRVKERFGAHAVSSEGTPGSGDPNDLWMRDYAKAMTAAEHRHAMLLIYFCDVCEDSLCSRFKAETLDNPQVRSELCDYVCVQLPLSAKITVEGREVTLLEDPAFQEMLGRPGVAIVDFRSSDPELYGAVVSMFPITEKLWYTPERMTVILDLPPGTLTQRTLIYAVRIHPEKPASASSQLSPDLLQEAESHSRYQANLRLQGHHQWGTRFQRIVARLPGGITAREVCAESWPGENLVEAAIECVRCWRLSDGHWSAVRAPNRFFGYDMKRGGNGVWYATGIFGAR